MGDSDSVVRLSWGGASADFSYSTSALAVDVLPLPSDSMLGVAVDPTLAASGRPDHRDPSNNGVRWLDSLAACDCFSASL